MNDLRASSSTSSTGLLTEDDDMPLRPRKKQATTFTTTKTVYIKKIDCQINNTSVDQGIYI